MIRETREHERDTKQQHKERLSHYHTTHLIISVIVILRLLREQITLLSFRLRFFDLSLNTHSFIHATHSHFTPRTRDCPRTICLQFYISAVKKEGKILIIRLLQV